MSHSQDSIYLYDKELREEYLTAFEKKKCPHQFKVISYLDKDRHVDEKESFLTQHIQTCQQCQDQALRVMDYFKRMEKLIPEMPLSHQTKAELERHHKTMIKGSRWDVSLEQKLKVLLRDSIVPGLQDLLSVLSRPNVLIASFVAVLLLYFTLNA